MSEDPIKQLEQAATEFDTIDNELEQLKSMLTRRSHQIVQALPKHEMHIVSAEKTINKNFTKARKNLVNRTAQSVLTIGSYQPEMERSMDILVAQHLEENGFETVAQLMKPHPANNQTKTDENGVQLSKFEQQTMQTLDNMLNATLTLQVAVENGMDPNVFTQLRTIGLRLRFYKALSEGTASAFAFLQLEGTLAFRVENGNTVDDNDQTIKAMKAEFEFLSRELMSVRSDEAERKYRVSRHSVFNKLSLFFGNKRDFLGFDETDGTVSDLELLAEASQMAINTHYKESRMVNWNQDAELPVEFKLDDKFRFHPIFVCPVTSEQNAGSAIVLLKCGHLLSREAFHRFVVMRGGSKCPYCPAIVRVRDERYVHLSMN